MEKGILLRMQLDNMLGGQSVDQAAHNLQTLSYVPAERPIIGRSGNIQAVPAAADIGLYRELSRFVDPHEFMAAAHLLMTTRLMYENERRQQVKSAAEYIFPSNPGPTLSKTTLESELNNLIEDFNIKPAYLFIDGYVPNTKFGQIPDKRINANIFSKDAKELIQGQWNKDGAIHTIGDRIVAYGAHVIGIHASDEWASKTPAEQATYKQEKGFLKDVYTRHMAALWTSRFQGVTTGTHSENDGDNRWYENGEIIASTVSGEPNLKQLTKAQRYLSELAMERRAMFDDKYHARKEEIARNYGCPEAPDLIDWLIKNYGKAPTAIIPFGSMQSFNGITRDCCTGSHFTEIEPKHFYPHLSTDGAIQSTWDGKIGRFMVHLTGARPDLAIKYAYKINPDDPDFYKKLDHAAPPGTRTMLGYAASRSAGAALILGQTLGIVMPFIDGAYRKDIHDMLKASYTPKKVY